MKIGIDGQPLTASLTGIGTYVYHCLSRMIVAEPSYEFVSIYEGRLPADAPLRSLRASNHRAKRIPLPFRVSRFMKERLTRLPMDLLTGKFDVFHATCFIPPTIRLTKVVCTFYDLAFLAVPDAYPRWQRDYFQRHLPFAARRADAFITLSEHSKKDMIRFLDIPPDMVTIAYPGVDSQFSRPPDALRTREVVHRLGIPSPYVLFVGMLNDRKNVVRLIRAFHTLVRRSKGPWHLVLAGPPGDAYEACVDAVQRLGLRSRVRFCGRIEGQDDLVELYRGAELFAFPSRYEGFGIPLLEAMAAGTPVVTSNVSSIPEVVGDAAMLADPLDEDAIAEAMQRVLEDRDLAERLRERGLLRAQAFTWESTAQTTLAVYRCLASRG